MPRTGRPSANRIVLRGKDENGRDLIIAPDYIAHGMRHRASDLATQWLGPRTELEIRESLSKEVTQERWADLFTDDDRVEAERRLASPRRRDPG